MVKVASPEQYRIVAAEIEKCRYKADLTQAELARRMGATQKFVSLVETGARRVDVLELFAFERGLELPALTLVRQIHKAVQRAADAE